ncbi:hypothetical protein [Phormidesmis priestleyi]|nr:hypothetical protein [Phormidesmis priestleyi]
MHAREATEGFVKEVKRSGMLGRTVDTEVGAFVDGNFEFDRAKF